MHRASSGAPKDRSQSGLPIVSSFLALALLAGCGGGDDAPGAMGVGGHEHGVARIDLAVDGTNADLRLVAPAGDVVGFEGDPRTPEEGARVEAGLALLRERISEAVVFDPALRCAFIPVRVGYGEEDPGPDPEREGTSDEQDHEEDAHDHAEEGGHGDIHAEFRVECEGALAGSPLRFRFGTLLPDLQHVDLQLVGDRTLGGRYRAEGARLTL